MTRVSKELTTVGRNKGDKKKWEKNEMNKRENKKVKIRRHIYLF
jgi:hypothetical protein